MLVRRLKSGLCLHPITAVIADFNPKGSLTRTPTYNRNRRFGNIDDRGRIIAPQNRAQQNRRLVGIRDQRIYQGLGQDGAVVETNPKIGGVLRRKAAKFFADNSYDNPLSIYSLKKRLKNKK